MRVSPFAATRTPAGSKGTSSSVKTPITAVGKPASLERMATVLRASHPRQASLEAFAEAVSDPLGRALPGERGGRLPGPRSSVHPV